LLLPEAAIYCLQQDLAVQAVFRPAADSRSISDLYLAGSSTHPGYGDPTTIACKLIAQNDESEKELTCGKMALQNGP
jgi:phytoene dehydrogenase-like protein